MFAASASGISARFCMSLPVPSIGKNREESEQLYNAHLSHIAATYWC